MPDLFYATVIGCACLVWSAAIVARPLHRLADLLRDTKILLENPPIVIRKGAVDVEDPS
jgi:hypothetical protein